MMPKLTAVALVAFAGFSVAMAQSLPADPRVVSGELPNGLAYYVMQHDNPPKRSAVWMHVDTGSLNETDKQRGIAHYLEHMAFNGSKNFPPGSLVKYFESLGLRFGGDLNASTSFDQTNYQLFLPDNSIEKLRQSLLFMSDVNGRLLLEPKEIEAERQIILEEKTARQSGRQRIQDYINTRMAPGSIFGERSPIGTVETIKGVMQEDFKDYYAKYYTPSNSAVIVVADMDPKVVVAEITSAFSDMTERKPKPQDQEVGITPYGKSFAVVATDSELTRATVGFSKIGPPLPPVRTEAQLREEYVRSLASEAFNRHLQDKTIEGKVSFQGGLAYASGLANTMWQTHAQASGEPTKWKQMLMDLATEVQRSRAFGFTQKDIDDARKELLSRAEQQAQTEPTLPARAFIMRINGAIADGEPVRSAAQRLESAKKILPGITAKECSEWFTKEFDPANVMFFVQLPSNAEVPTEAQLLELGEAALKVKPAADAQAMHATRLMDKLPTAGAVTEQDEHKASGVWSAWLSNGVRVHHKFSDYRKNDVSVSISLIGGELLETPENRGITAAATQAWSQQATSKLSATDIRSLMADKKVRVGGGGGGGGRGGRGGGGGGGADSIRLSVSGTPDELEVGMQLAHLLLTDPKIEEVAFDRWKTNQLESIEAREKNPGQMFGKMTADAIYPENEVRNKPLTKEMVDRLTRDVAQKWLNKLIAESPIEVGIVGDITKERATELATKYMGSIPTRARIDGNVYADKRKLQRPKGPRVVTNSMVTKTPTANVLVGFYGPDSKNIADVRAMNMAARVLSSRMVQEVREKEQLVYSISATCQPGSAYPGFGLFRASAPTQPEKPDALAAKLAEMYATFAKDGPTDEEMAVAKGQFANSFDESMKEPAYWLGMVDSMTYDGRNMDDVLGAPAAAQAMTKEQVKAAFNKYFGKENMVTVILKPVGEKESN